MARRYPWLFLVLLLGLAVRLLFLAKGAVVPDSDEAIVGLMAQHIVEGREWPIFYYGQHYMGSLESTLTVPVFYLFGSNPWTLRVVPLIFSLLFIYAVFLLGERIGGKRVARYASLLAAVPPFAFVEWSTKARGGFIEVLFLGTLALVIAASALQEKKAEKGHYFWLAFILGLGWWVNNQIIFYIAPLGLVLGLHLLLNIGILRTLQLGAGAFAFFILGGAPFWYANLLEKPRFATFKQLGGHSKFPEETLLYFQRVFEESIPILLGARRFWTNVDLFPYARPVALTVAAMVLLLSIGLLLPRSKELRGLGVLVLMVLFTPVIFALSSYGSLTIAPRYLLPLYSVWFVIVALVTDRVRLASILLPVFLGFALCSNYLGGVQIPGQPFVANGERVSTSHEELYKWLENHRYSHVRTSYWIGYRVAFETHERVTFTMVGDPYTPRIPRYQAIGQDFLEEAPFILVPSQEGEVSAALIQLNIPFVRSIVSGYVILEPIPTVGLYLADPSAIGEDVPPIPVTIEGGSSRPGWLANLTDDDPSTRWGSGEPQHPGMFLEGSLPAGSRVEEVEVDLGFWVSDAGRWLAVELQGEDGKVCSIFDGPTALLHEVQGRKLRFSTSPMRATKVKLEQLGSDPVFDWSVAELEVRGTKE